MRDPAHRERAGLTILRRLQVRTGQEAIDRFSGREGAFEGIGLGAFDRFFREDDLRARLRGKLLEGNNCLRGGNVERFFPGRVRRPACGSDRPNYDKGPQLPPAQNSPLAGEDGRGTWSSHAFETNQPPGAPTGIYGEFEGALLKVMFEPVRSAEMPKLVSRSRTKASG